MRIFIILNSSGFQQHHSIIHFTQIVYGSASKRLEQVGHMTFFLINFHPKRQAGGFHLLRY
jgi:hypothetical protein